MPGPPLLAQDPFVDRTSSRTLNYCEVWEPACVKSWRRLILRVTTYCQSLHSVYTNNWVQLAWEHSTANLKSYKMANSEGYLGFPDISFMHLHTLFFPAVLSENCVKKLSVFPFQLFLNCLNLCKNKWTSVKSLLWQSCSSLAQHFRVLLKKNLYCIPNACLPQGPSSH